MPRLTDLQKQQLIQREPSKSAEYMLGCIQKYDNLNLDDFPNMDPAKKKRIEDMMNSIPNTAEQAEWSRITAIGDTPSQALLDALNNYIRNWESSRPMGNHVDEARQRLTAIELPCPLKPLICCKSDSSKSSKVNGDAISSACAVGSICNDLMLDTPIIDTDNDGCSIALDANSSNDNINVICNDDMCHTPIIDTDNDGCFDYDLISVSLPTSDADAYDSDNNCLEIMWRDDVKNKPCISAHTAASPDNSIRPEKNDSYVPQKKSPNIKLKLSNKRKWWNLWKRVDQYETVQDYGDEISACVYAPAQVQPLKTFIVRVYLYKPEETEEVDSKVQSIDPKAQKKEYRPLDIPVKENDRLTVQLKMSDGITLNTDTKTVTWRNHFTDCSFMAKLNDEKMTDVFGSAYLSVNGVPAGEMLFTIDVVKSQEKNLYAKVESRRYSRIFISYSHADELQVQAFAECCRAIGTDYFFDRHTLKVGDIFKDKILDYINNADLFVLCWSKNAAESEWVRIEREHALSLIREGNSKLSIYPLSLKPEAPLPLDMSDKYNFGSL